MKLRGLVPNFYVHVFRRVGQGTAAMHLSCTLQGMEQISIKTPNPKCRIFLKIDLYRYLAAGVYLSEPSIPSLPLLHTV